ncbi:IclR family transcriptional regulator [Aquibacillus saliphilus]|uniref:IclR family transcriptional regulator n=1 Tax=Aquibacillus saliphilus TaxID=1909422 RepID=UPI001CEFB6C0|nr:IclR family transcriptional regulator [Aquibacillus saliphilus]
MSSKSSGSLVAERTLQVILLFQNNKKLTLSEIAKSLEISNTATHRIVSTLWEQGFLLRDESKRYMLGSIFIKLAQMVEPNLRNTALPIMKKLSKETQESIYLSISHNPSYYVFIEGVESPHPLKWSVDFGNPASTYAGAGGKTHLAFHNEDRWSEVIHGNDLTPYTNNTIIDKAKLLNELETIRTQGYAISKSERYQGVIAISVPVNNISRQATSTMALSIFIPEYRFEDNKLDFYISMLMKAAREITLKL